MRSTIIILAIVAGLWNWGSDSSLHAADEFEKAPIAYSESTPDNAISKLQARLESGEVKLDDADARTFLRSVLAALDVPVESQMLVFSKTSMQRHCIAPRTPRAIYFNDDVYVGYCVDGAVLEISAADPKLGTVFYTLDVPVAERPEFIRQTDNCLVCHSSSRTGSVPGHLVRSVFTDAGGQPILSAGGYSVDQTTPIEQRWGGWYVTGTHGKQTHIGNRIFKQREAIEREMLKPDAQQTGQNLTELGERIAAGQYLSPHSDIVALMVLEHQTLVHNRITQANFTTRQALHYDDEMSKILNEEPGSRLESTTRRINGAAEELLEAMLLVGEAPLAAPIEGTSGFADQFAARGPTDGKGRSLRQFDLMRRLFKYPCSYLIYSESFEKLPAEVQSVFWQRLGEVLSGQDTSEKFAHLSADDRQAIREILLDTKRNLPEDWQAKSNSK